MIPPRSELVGETVYPGMVTESGDLVVLAVQRKEEDLSGETTLEAGDTFLLRGTWSALERRLDDPDVLAVNEPERIRRQAVPLGPGATRSVVVLAGMVVLLATSSTRSVTRGRACCRSGSSRSRSCSVS